VRRFLTCRSVTTPQDASGGVASCPMSSDETTCTCGLPLIGSSRRICAVDLKAIQVTVHVKVAVCRRDASPQLKGLEGADG
jgi:hypothetical protein